MRSIAPSAVPRAVIILGIYVVLAVAVAVVGDVVVPSMVKEVHRLSHNAPQYARDLRSQWRRSATTTTATTSPQSSCRMLAACHRPSHIWRGRCKDVTVQAFSFIGQLVTVLALTFLLMLHGRDYVNMGLSLTGARREHHKRLIIEVNKAVAGYMLG